MAPGHQATGISTLSPVTGIVMIGSSGSSVSMMRFVVKVPAVPGLNIISMVRDSPVQSDRNSKAHRKP